MKALPAVRGGFDPNESRAANSLLVACGTKTVAIAVQPPLADRACSGAGRVRVEIDSISADCARSVAVAVIVSVYAFVAERACRSAVAVTALTPSLKECRTGSRSLRESSAMSFA